MSESTTAQSPPRRRRSDATPPDIAIQVAVLTANHQALERRMDGITTDGAGIKERLVAVELGQKQMASEQHGFINDNKAAMARQDEVLATIVAAQRTFQEAIDRQATEIQHDRVTAAKSTPILAEIQRYHEEQRRAEEARAATIKRAAEDAAERLRDEARDTAQRQRDALFLVAGLIGAVLTALVGTLVGLVNTPGARPLIFSVTLAIIFLSVVAVVIIYKYVRRRRP